MAFDVRRSVSLRSHRTHGSGSGSSLQSSRDRSSANLVHAQSPPLVSPCETPDEDNHQLEHHHYHQTTTPVERVTSPPPAARLRDKLSHSARSFSQRFKSTDTLPILLPERPPVTAASTSPPLPLARGFTFGETSGHTTTTSMLAAPAAPRRPPPDRPSTSAAHSSFTRDISSSYGNANGAPLQHSTSSTTTLPGSNPASIYQSIHETSTKRIATIEYIRNVHDGNVYYFNTIHFTSAALSTVPSLAPHKLGRRATNYIVLGHSLPALLDLNSGSALEYLKALSGLLQEFELYQSLSGADGSGSSLGRGRMGQMFKSGIGLGGRSSKGRRSSTAAESLFFAEPTAPSRTNILGLPLSGGGGGGGSAGGSEATSPMEMTSPIQAVGHEFTYLLTPYLAFEPDFAVTFATLCDALIDSYARLLDLVSGPDVCGPGVADAFAKADKAIRKILVANVMREFDDATRSHARSEVAGLGRLVLGGLM